MYLKMIISERRHEEQWDFRDANLKSLHRTLNVNREEIFDQEEEVNQLRKKWKTALFLLYWIRVFRSESPKLTGHGPTQLEV